MARRRLGSGWRALLLAEGMLLAGGGIAFAAPRDGAEAQASPDTTVEEIVVTAQRREESSQQVPFTVTALGQADLTARGAQTIEQAIGYVPGVSLTSNGTGGGAYTIRGVNTSTYVAGAQSPVALYIDDINILDPFFPKVTPALRLFDVNRVEVLEGPQGTLFGSGSIGGAIRVVTNRPNSTDFESEIESTASGVDGGGRGYNLNAMVNFPIVPGALAMRLVGHYDRTPGWVDNVARSQSDVNQSIASGGRAELEWTPSPDASIVGSVLYEHERPRDAPFSFYDNKRYEWDGLVPNTNSDRTTIYSISGVDDLHWATLTSITTYADRSENIQADFSPVIAGALGVVVASPDINAGPSRTFSQEVRLASPNDGRFRWLVGAIYIDNKRSPTETLDVPGSGALFGAPSDFVLVSNQRFDTREEAVFGEISYDILPQLTATVGVRAFSDRLERSQVIGGTLFAPSQTSSSPDESSATPKFNLSYHLSPASMLYVQAAQGYRIGQTNSVTEDPFTHTPIPAASSPDSLWSYEAGEKSTFFNGHLLANASIYYIDWSNIQLNQRSPSGINFIGNAGEAHIEGFELQLQARLSQEWDLGGSLNISHARLVSVNATTAATEGDKLPGSAPFTGVVYAAYTHPIGNVDLFARVDARWVGKEFSDLHNSTSLTFGDYSTVNVRTGINWDRYSATLFLDNVTNDDGKISAVQFAGQRAAIRQKPFTVGVTLDARF